LPLANLPFRMRLFLCLALGWIVLIASASAETPALLQTAVDAVLADGEHWAFTETTVQRDGKGQVEHTRVVRVDPSQPYEQQYVPITIDGKPPSEKQLANYRKRGERWAKAKEKEQAEHPDNLPRINLKGAVAVVDFSAAHAIDEGPQSITYEVPLRSESKKTMPTEKFLLLARVNKEKRGFENLSIKLQSPLRLGLILKVKAGEAVIDFATVDPKYGPVAVTFQAGGSASVFFVPLSQQSDVKRTDFRRVTPYRDRFGVTVGPLKTIEF
jgi:hypothetical protein